MSKDSHGAEDSVQPNTDVGLADKESELESFENITSEEGFKGFPRVPRVSIERTDISPYLKKMKSIHKTKKNLKSVLIDRFFQCRVKLVRDDLHKLLEKVNQPERLYKCKICAKTYSDLRKLANHHDNKHLIVYGPLKPPKRVSFSDKIIVHEVIEYHECRKCTKIFESYALLKKHMKENHKKRKCYICHYCHKKFVDRSIFKVHIKLHCDVCGDLSPTKAKFAEHRRYVCKIYKLYKCPTCHIALYRYIDLKYHNYDHSDNVFICDCCKDKFNSKPALAHHIHSAHSTNQLKDLYEVADNGSDVFYECRLCDTRSMQKVAIENHIASFKDLSSYAVLETKSYFSCDDCTLYFDKETELTQHKWTHYLKKTEETNTEKVLKSSLKMPTQYDLKNDIPLIMKPKVVVERLNKQFVLQTLNAADKNQDSNQLVLPSTDNSTITNEEPKMNKELKKNERKKTINSKYQCELCLKYYVSAFCLRRHIETKHRDFENLKCKDCEEIFVWPSLLMSHNCLRIPVVEEHFDDSRPEIMFDNIPSIEYQGVDFEIPQATDGIHFQNGGQNGFQNGVQTNTNEIVMNGYKMVVQEVPIEF